MTQRHKTFLRLAEVGLVIAIVCLLAATLLPAIVGPRL
jgi:hypothetical protein